jgi:hypothetical protein
MGKLRELKDRMTHKGQGSEPQDVRNEDDNAFLHKSSHETGADVTYEQGKDKPKKGVY